MAPEILCGGKSLANTLIRTKCKIFKELQKLNTEKKKKAQIIQSINRLVN